MRYMLLIYTQEAQADHSPEAMKPWLDYGEKYKKEIEAGEPLYPTTTAKSVTHSEDAFVTTDGPFAETKEQFGGYYILDVADEAEALKIAADCPASKFGTVEVRQILNMADC